jgi:hypothetical protein
VPVGLGSLAGGDALGPVAADVPPRGARWDDPATAGEPPNQSRAAA